MTPWYQVLCLPPMPYAVVLDALVEAGIEVEGAARAADGPHPPPFRCRRGPASFTLTLSDDGAGVVAKFLVGWTGRLDYVVWCRSLHYQLVRDALAVLDRFGATDLMGNPAGQTLP